MSIKHVLLASALTLGLAGPAFAAGEGSGSVGAKSGASVGVGTDAGAGVRAGTDANMGAAAGTGTGAGVNAQSGAGVGVGSGTPANPDASGAVSGSASGDANTGTMGTTGTMQGQAGVTEIPANQLVGRDVVGSDGDELGSVDEVVYDAQGQVSRVILEVGGILGIGSKTVAVERSQIQGDLRGSADQPVMISMTKEQLENAPEYDAEAETGVRMGTK